MLKNRIGRFKIKGHLSDDIPEVLIWGRANKHE